MNKQANRLFDAKFRVEKEICLTIADEEPLHKGDTIWRGPDACFWQIEPGVYFVHGLNLDEHGRLQDEEYWRQDSGLSGFPRLTALDLRALQKMGRITLLEGSFDSNVCSK
jgi:hypothetical protein